MTGLLILFALDVLGKGLWLLPVMAALLLICRRKLQFRGDFFLLALFSLSYLLFDGWREMDFFYTVLFLPAAFLVGLNCKRDTKPEDIRKTLCLLALAMAAHGLLNLVWGNGKDLWTGMASSATAQLLGYAPLAALAGTMLVGRVRSLWLLVPVLLSLVHTAELGGRTLLALLALSLCVGAAAGWRWMPEGRGRIFRRFMGLLGGIAAIGVALKQNCWGLGTWFQSSYLYHRRFSPQALEREVSFFQTDRWSLKREYLSGMLAHPFGGGALFEQAGNYAHDLLLDVWDRGGAVAWGLLLLYLLRAALRWKGLIAVSSGERKVLFLCWGVTALAVLFVEPVLQGAPLYLCVLCLLDGMCANLETRRLGS